MSIDICTKYVFYKVEKVIISAFKEEVKEIGVLRGGMRILGELLSPDVKSHKRMKLSPEAVCQGMLICPKGLLTKHHNAVTKFRCQWSGCRRRLFLAAGEYIEYVFEIHVSGLRCQLGRSLKSRSARPH